MRQSGTQKTGGHGAHSSLEEVLQVAPADPTGPRFKIEDIYPRVDGGRYPVKRIAGETVDVWADIFREGHDVIAAALRWRLEQSGDWQYVPMTLHSNDRWHGAFSPPEPGSYLYQIEAWTDQFATWRKELKLKIDAGQNVALEVREGNELLNELAVGEEAKKLFTDAARQFTATGNPAPLLDDALAVAIRKAQRSDLSRSHVLSLTAERERARAGAWYEMVPRSQGRVPGKHGTFDDCIARVPEIAALGFDVLYLTPIHPIGRTNRKGRNNATKAQPGDPGSFYAIGSQEGGHDAVHPELGTLADFERLVDACRTHRMEVAIDFAVQCSPDHPWLKQHPEWFRSRPDGTIRFAENPPKKYEDIVNPDFTCADRISLWVALRDIVIFWIDHGVRIFRVDNPHTKPLPFWEWLIREVRAQHPDVIFLAEAFTRPKIMKSLAKIGFTQSYSYFTWRTGKEEIQAYLSDLTHYPEREYYRANFFVTTPDILPIQLQSGEPWLFKARAALAATLSSNYGIYNGYELLEHEPLPGREEYLNSEKYEIRVRDWNKPGNIKDYLKHLNMARRFNPALLQTANLHFLQVDDGNVIGFLKQSADGNNTVAVAIGLANGPRQFWMHFGTEQIGPPEARRPVRTIENVLTGERYSLEWNGVRLHIDASNDPALIFRCYA